MSNKEGGSERLIRHHDEQNRDITTYDFDKCDRLQREDYNSYDGVCNGIDGNAMCKICLHYIGNLYPGGIKMEELNRTEKINAVAKKIVNSVLMETNDDISTAADCISASKKELQLKSLNRSKELIDSFKNAYCQIAVGECSDCYLWWRDEECLLDKTKEELEEKINDLKPV